MSRENTPFSLVGVNIPKIPLARGKLKQKQQLCNN